MMGTVTFPGLGLEFHLNRVAFQLFRERNEGGERGV